MSVVPELRLVLPICAKSLTRLSLAEARVKQVVTAAQGTHRTIACDLRGHMIGDHDAV
jgi:hypothetical protein